MNINIISVTGFHGIGKTILVKEGIKRTYNNASIKEIKLSSAHFGARLTLELCSLSGLEIPPDGTPYNELKICNLTAIEKLISQKTFLIFNRFELILDEEGRPSIDFQDIIKYFIDKDILSSFPFIIITSRWVDYNSFPIKRIGFLKVQGLSDKHLSYILKTEIERISPNSIQNVDAIEKIGSLLLGYPLAGKLAAPLIVKYGPEYLLTNLHLINQIKIDIAEDILSQMSIGSTEVEIMELLAVFEDSLNPSIVAEILNMDSEDFHKYIDAIFSHNLIETDGESLILHPLVNDFYFKLARVSPNFTAISEKLSDVAKKELDKLTVFDKEYVFWLTKTCRLLFYCGKHNEARLLRNDLLGELRYAAIKLYERRDYSLALEYCNEYLETFPNDKEILFTRARCLSRLGKVEDAVELLHDLKDEEINKHQIAKLNYALGRTYIENSQIDEDYLDKAQEYLSESLTINEHQSALQSMGELLFRKNRMEDAASFIERKLQYSPSDPYALSIYSEILWAMDRKPEALAKIIEALKHQPKNPNFIFRAGRFLYDSGKYDEAYKYFSQAVALDESYFDARLSLADLCLDLDYIDEAKNHIDYLDGKLKGDKRNILDSIIANYSLKINDHSKAEEIANRLVKYSRNVHNLGLLAKIHIYKYREAVKNGLVLVAEIDKKKALELVTEGLKIDSTNYRLNTMLRSLT